MLPRVTSTLRSNAEQSRLYNRYLAGAAQFPVAPPGTSAHEFGYAFDMVVTPFDALADVGAYWQQMGGKWGRSDPVHFEYPGFRPGAANTAVTPKEGGAFATLIDFLSGFVPYLGEAQLASYVFGLIGHDESTAEWYLQHPAEAYRDLIASIFS